MSENDRTNGFRIRGFNGDMDRLAVQSTHETTWFLGRRWFGLAKWFEVGLAKNEIKVLRPYGAAPEIEIEGLGGPHGVIIVEATRTATRVLRNGQRCRFALEKDEAVVIKCENWREPRADPFHATGV